MKGSSDCQTERICYHKAYVDPPAHRLLGGRYSWRRDDIDVFHGGAEGAAAPSRILAGYLLGQKMEDFHG